MRRAGIVEISVRPRIEFDGQAVCNSLVAEAPARASQRRRPFILDHERDAVGSVGREQAPGPGDLESEGRLESAPEIHRIGEPGGSHILYSGGGQTQISVSEGACVADLHDLRVAIETGVVEA